MYHLRSGPRRLGRLGMAVGLAVVLLAAIACAAGAYEHRRGTPSVGGQLHLGVLEYDSEWGERFDLGHGGTIKLRQYVARNRAVGITFELQKFDSAPGFPAGDESFNPDYLQMQILLVDYYLYFRRPQRRTPYVVLSAGFYRPEIVDEITDRFGGTGEQVEHPGEGFIGRTGIGLEYFVSRTFSFDATLSGYYIHAPSRDGLTVSGMAALGIHLYTGR